MIKLFLNKVKTRLDSWGATRKFKAYIDNNSFPLDVTGVERGFLPFLLWASLGERLRNALVIVPSEKEAEELAGDLQILLPDEILHFPGWQTVPYAMISSAESVFQKRSQVLTLLGERARSVVVTSLGAALGFIPDKADFWKNVLSIKTGDTFALPSLEMRLAALGYTRVPRVSLASEFAVRGEVIDLFIPHAERPVRLLFDFDRIESIREFDPITQISETKQNAVKIPGVHEVIISNAERTHFLAAIEKAGYAAQEARKLLEQLELNGDSSGLEYYLPLFLKFPGTIFDHLPHDDIVFFCDEERLEAQARLIDREYQHQYALAKKQHRIVVKPEELICDHARLQAARKNRVSFRSGAPGVTSEGSRSVSFVSTSARSFFGNIQFFKQELAALRKADYTVAVFAGFEAQAVRIRHIIAESGAEIFALPLSQGFALPDLKIIVIAEHEIFRRKKRIACVLRHGQSEKIDSFTDLEEGDFVVHIQHGIGCYRGIERVTSSVFERDYIRLEYAEGEILFLPTEQVNLIERYIVPGGKSPRLDKIGGKGWSARKERVKASVAELAEHLLALYALRKKTPGFAFCADTEWQEQFEAGFPYEETPDQLASIQDVKRDMEQPFPMDRLICGDVGYGKTEVALRAAFKAAMGGKQVAILAPTTILVEQHYENFTERFENFPVQIRMLSRFVPKAEQKKTVAELAANKVDIVIGTHRLVQKDIHFKNLGLLIIDEEQRFGVRHKERIKELKANIDCLVLSATPIPRTLYMSLMKIRDMSQLATPPQNRLPIETFVREADETIIAEAIRREIERDGQIFYLHNRIESIDRVAGMLTRLFPELRIAVAHGRMNAEELEDVMHGFIRADYHILLSTAIIENGIDIPNVNTIIIDRADMFGISQLYQLRGRVGRSDVPAYAYLLYPDRRALSERAMKRLKIISDFTDLGSGFKIALKDLELRGAGNLLGSEQHGDILSVGFEMYMKLLHEAIEQRKGRDEENPAAEVFLELEYSGFIPDEYIGEPMEKMEAYKQIAAVTTEADLEALVSRLEDRFGPIPDELSSIISISELRIIAGKLSIISLRERQGVVRIEFGRVSTISATNVVRLIKESGGSVFLKNNVPQCLFIKTGIIGLKEKSSFIKEKLAALL